MVAGVVIAATAGVFIVSPIASTFAPSRMPSAEAKWRHARVSSTTSTMEPPRSDEQGSAKPNAPEGKKVMAAPDLIGPQAPELP